MQKIHAEDLKKLLDEDKAILIDVREPSEHQSKSIPCASLIPLSEICLQKLPKSSKKIVIHCHSGKRSLAACEKLIRENSSLNVYSLDGGILAWEQAGFELKKSCSRVLPLNQQTQITIGGLSLIGCFLGFSINQLFYIIPTIISCGLIFSGLSGWCGMSLLLSKLPWNK